MNAAGLVMELRARGVTLVADGGTLRCRPKSALSDTDLSALKSMKAEILAALQPPAPSRPVMTRSGSSPRSEEGARDLRSLLRSMGFDLSDYGPIHQRVMQDDFQRGLREVYGPPTPPARIDQPSPPRILTEFELERERERAKERRGARAATYAAPTKDLAFQLVPLGACSVAEALERAVMRAAIRACDRWALTPWDGAA